MERTDGHGSPARISRSTLTNQLVDALRVDILEGSLRPGERIRVQEMATRYGVSATPFREALQRLATNGLVELDPRMGARVSPISQNDLTDIYDMLKLLDSLALRRSVERGDQEWLRDLERAFQSLPRTDATASSGADGHGGALQWATVHWEFHRTLYEACGSKWLIRFVTELHEHAERYRILALHGSSGYRRDSRHEHEMIFNAAKARDIAGAEAALVAHLDMTVRLLLKEMPAL